MTPTPKLRFLERDGPAMFYSKGSDGSNLTLHQKIRILQQWWAVERAGQITPEGEWRDVPCERE
jgi:hypothetical protein